MEYHLGVICKNGHCISSYGDQALDKHCETCGAEIITRCPECGTPIRGTPNVDESWLYQYNTPSFCWNCGNPFPWTESAIASASMLIEEEAKLSALEQGRLIESLPDIVSETPRTQIAVVRFKKAMVAAGKFTAEGLRQFAIDFGCELAKKQLGL